MKNKLITQWKELYIDMSECHRILEFPMNNVDTDTMREWINTICVVKNQFDDLYEQTFKYVLENRRQ